jgi:radical SAM protein with 4Fe4S-binding SPASM domain
MVNMTIGEKLVLVSGANKWAIYDFDQKNIFRFNSSVGKLLKLIYSKDASSAQKISFVEKQYPELFNILEISKIVNRLFVEWHYEIPLKNYSRKTLWIEVTNQCNYRCIHCYNLSKPDNTDFLNTQKIFDIIDQAFSFRFNTIQFSGGEPLLHPDIGLILQQASKYNFKAIELYTNLFLLDADHIEILKDHNIHVATTMLGASSKVYDKCTNHIGSFIRWQKNILNLKENDIALRISVVRMKQNQDDMLNIKAFLRKHSLINKNDEIYPDDIRPVGRASSCFVPEKPYGTNKQIELYIEVSEEKYFFSKVYNTCWGGSLAISATGDIFPCIFARNQLIGNIHEISLTDVINSKVDKYWKITLDKVDKCKDCEYRYACYDCRALSLNYGRGLFGKPVRCDFDPYKG